MLRVYQHADLGPVQVPTFDGADGGADVIWIAPMSSLLKYGRRKPRRLDLQTIVRLKGDGCDISIVGEQARKKAPGTKGGKGKRPRRRLEVGARRPERE